MLTVRTKLKEITGKGISLIAAEDIKKNAPIWLQDSDFCVKFTAKQIAAMHDIQKEFMARYTTLEPDGNRQLVLDDIRFMNHSENPNTAYDETRGWALRDIKAGEEITCDYRILDDDPMDFKIVE